jgi:hypothetical protein
MNKKKILISILVFLLAALLLLFLKNKFFKSSNQQKTSITQNNSATKNDKLKFLLTGFPIEQVPLYKLTKISSSNIFVNTDPKNTSAFEDENYAYYNVVFESTASQKEFLSYYQSLFDQTITEEYPNEEMVKGYLGPYKVTASHYGSNNTGYLQVYLANYQDEKLNEYFIDFPQIVEKNQFLLEHEISYGLLNQKNGEIEFTKYFTVIDSGDQNQDGKDDLDEFAQLTREYQDKYQSKTNYQYDEKTTTMQWQDQELSITLAISKSHNRIYLMVRKPL